MTKSAFIEKQKPLCYDELFDLWLKYKAVRVRSSSLAIYRCHIKAHLSPLLGDIPLNAMDEDTLNHLCFYGLYGRWDQCGELSTKSRIDLIRTFNNILTFGFEHQYLSQQIQIDSPRASLSKMKILREEEQKKLEQILHKDFSKNEVSLMYSPAAGTTMQ